jgi:signal peptidase I
VATPPEEALDFKYYLETNAQGSHVVRFFSEAPGGRAETREWTVPAGEYFFMGDNRDQSADGRVWGFVPENNLIGKAWFVWLSCDEMLESAKFVCHPGKLRWNRFFQSVEP